MPCGVQEGHGFPTGFTAHGGLLRQDEHGGCGFEQAAQALVALFGGGADALNARHLFSSHRSASSPTPRSAEWFVRKIGVAGVPGSSFFREPEHRFIRFHFAKKEETLGAAGVKLERLRKGR